MQPWFTAHILDIGHPCYGQLTSFKTRCKLTSITGPYLGDSGDMAVRMRKVLARPWVGVRVRHLLLLFFNINLLTHQSTIEGWSTFSAHAAGELPSGHQPTAFTCIVWSFVPTSGIMGRLYTVLSPIFCPITIFC